MGKAKNIEAREHIYTGAIRLFSENGYNKTSFTDIAKDCGVKRALVQYYFPYKEIFMQEFLTRCLSGIADQAADLDPERFDSIGIAYYMGAVSFAFLINSPKMQKISPDIIRSRQMTEALMPMYSLWDQKLTGAQFSEEITVMSIGGAYDLLYYYIQTGKTVDSSYITEKSFDIFTGLHGISQQDAKNRLDRYRLSSQELSDAVTAIEKELFR